MTDNSTEQPTVHLRGTIDGFLEQKWEIKDPTQHTFVWKPIPRPMYNGIVLYGSYYYDAD